MKPKLKPLGNKRLKLTFNGPLSSYSFKFNLRHYSVEIIGELATLAGAEGGGATRQAALSALDAAASRFARAPAAAAPLLAAAPAAVDALTASSRGVVAAAAACLAAIIRALGKAVQVDPIKPTSEAPGPERLKITCDMTLKDKPTFENTRRLELKCPKIAFSNVGLSLNVIYCFELLLSNPTCAAIAGAALCAVPTGGGAGTTRHRQRLGDGAGGRQGRGSRGQGGGGGGSG